MKDGDFATRLFAAVRAAQSADCEFSDHLARALGHDPRKFWLNPEGFAVDDWSYDPYDESYELHGCGSGFSWPRSAHEYMVGLGFRTCWINYVDGTAEHERWPRGRTPCDLEDA